MNRAASIAALIVFGGGAWSSEEAMTPIGRWLSTTRTLIGQHQPQPSRAPICITVHNRW